MIFVSGKVNHLIMGFFAIGFFATGFLAGTTFLAGALATDFFAGVAFFMGTATFFAAGHGAWNHGDVRATRRSTRKWRRPIASLADDIRE